MAGFGRGGADACGTGSLRVPEAGATGVSRSALVPATHPSMACLREREDQSGAGENSKERNILDTTPGEKCMKNHEKKREDKLESATVQTYRKSLPLGRLSATDRCESIATDGSSQPSFALVLDPWGWSNHVPTNSKVFLRSSPNFRRSTLPFQ